MLFRSCSSIFFIPSIVSLSHHTVSDGVPKRIVNLSSSFADLYGEFSHCVLMILRSLFHDLYSDISFLFRFKSFSRLLRSLSSLLFVCACTAVIVSEAIHVINRFLKFIVLVCEEYKNTFTPY